MTLTSRAPGLLSTVLLAWVRPVMHKARAGLTERDVPSSTVYDTEDAGPGVRVWHTRFEEVLAVGRPKGQDGSLPVRAVVLALCAPFWASIAIITAVKALADALLFAPPMLLRQLTQVGMPVGKGRGGAAFAAASQGNGVRGRIGLSSGPKFVLVATLPTRPHTRRSQPPRGQCGCIVLLNLHKL